MTVPAQVAVSTSEGDGVTTSFAWDFLISTPAEMSVTLYDTNEDPATLETLTASLYTATGFGDAGGGSIVYPLSGDPITAGQFISIYRAAPLTQDVTIGRMGKFFLSAIERGLDDNMRIYQDLATRIMELQPVIGGVPVPVMPSVLDATFTTLTASTASIGTLDATTASIGTLTASTASIGDLDAPAATFSDLSADSATVSTRVSISGVELSTTAVQSVSSGQTLTLSGAVNFTPLSLTQSAATLTIMLPTASQHGQVAGFSFDQDITALTVTASGATVKNPPLTTSVNPAGRSFVWIYHQPSTTWYRRGGSSPVPPPLRYLTASFSFDFPSIVTGSFSVTTTTITGGVIGDQVLVSGDWGVNQNLSINNCAWLATVSASDVMRISAFNFAATAINPSTGTFYVLCLPKSQFGF